MSLKEPLPARVAKAVREWLAEPKTFTARGGEPGLAREIIFAFWEEHPECQSSEEVQAVRTLNFIARRAGFEDVHRLLGGSICGADGSRSITLELVA